VTEDEFPRAIRGRLARFERRPISLGTRRSAAVAITIVGDAQPHFLLTRRPADAPRHPNQFALPGGRAEPDETAADTARRELAEELGLELPPESVLGLLDDYATRSGFVITPVVLWTRAALTLRPDPGEVAQVYRVSLDSLFADDLIQEQDGPEPGRPILSLSIVETLVFAPTAALILQFREVALCGRPTRVAHYDQPRFAWQ
jgi:8-oxo-dGTP pyrophosphatase MutT (NUDIX family)